MLNRKYHWVGVALEELGNGDGFTTKDAYEVILARSITFNSTWKRRIDFPNRGQLGQQLRFDARIEKIKSGLFRRK